MPVILATQEDLSSKPAWANSSQDIILKKPITKKSSAVAQGIGPEFNPQYHKKKKIVESKMKIQLVKICRI
jgi:hypothetical protein